MHWLVGRNSLLNWSTKHWWFSLERFHTWFWSAVGFTRGGFLSENVAVWVYSQSLAHNRVGCPETECSPVWFAYSVLCPFPGLLLLWQPFQFCWVFFYVSVSWKATRLEPGIPSPPTVFSSCIRLIHSPFADLLVAFLNYFIPQRSLKLELLCTCIYSWLCKSRTHTHTQRDKEISLLILHYHSQ